MSYRRNYGHKAIRPHEIACGFLVVIVVLVVVGVTALAKLLKLKSKHGGENGKASHY